MAQKTRPGNRGLIYSIQGQALLQRFQGIERDVQGVEEEAQQAEDKTPAGDP